MRYAHSIDSNYTSYITAAVLFCKVASIPQEGGGGMGKEKWEICKNVILSVNFFIHSPVVHLTMSVMLYKLSMN